MIENTKTSDPLEREKALLNAVQHLDIEKVKEELKAGATGQMPVWSVKDILEISIKPIARLMGQSWAQLAEEILSLIE